MIDTFLVPEKTVIAAKGDSAGLDISSCTSRTFLVALAITSTVEQQSIELSLFTSADGTTWDTKPAASLPQKFYVGEYPLLLDLAGKPEAKFLRAHWEVNRWGRGPTTPSFEVSLRVREVAPELLQEAMAEARARK